MNVIFINVNIMQNYFVNYIIIWSNGGNYYYKDFWCLWYIIIYIGSEEKKVSCMEKSYLSFNHVVVTAIAIATSLFMVALPSRRVMCVWKLPQGKVLRYIDHAYMIMMYLMYLNFSLTCTLVALSPSSGSQRNL